jgi:hypothetical protein
MSAHVFLSHVTADKPAVRELARRLGEEEGIQAWLNLAKYYDNTQFVLKS